MNFKSKLFRQPWENRDPGLRAQAVSENNDPALKSELGRIAEHDDSWQVRLAALKRINTEAFWLDARLRESEPDILEAADAFLAKAVMRKANPEMLKERIEWFRRIDDIDLIRNAARRAPDRALREAALERITAQGYLGDCVISETDDDLALSLLDRIDQESTLTRIARELRKSSKQRARAAEERLYAVRTAAGKSDPDGDSARDLVDAMEALARGEGEGDRKQRLEEIEKGRDELGDIPEPLRRRFEGAAAIVRRSLDRSTGAPRKQEGADHEDTGADQSDRIDEALARAADRIRDHFEAGSGSDDRIGALLSEWDRAWNAIEAPTGAEIALRDEILPLIRKLQRRHQPESPGKAPNKAAPEVPDFERELDEISALLEDGEIADAHERLRSVRSAYDRIANRTRPPAVGGRLSRMEGRLKEMRNWEHWSNNQIRDSLIDQVEQLADSGQHPDAITEALKQAREEWQRLEKLEVLPGDKRRHAAPPGQWRRFQTACKNAFETARPFFEKRHQVQEDNLEALNAFLEQGTRLAEDDEADTGEMTKFMRLARQSIRRLDDLPPKSRGRSAARLRALMDQLSSRLDSIHDQVETEKRRLIAEARQLAHESDLKTAIEKAKALQAKWQSAGSTHRRAEQKLWKEFREPIDPLFEQLKGAQREHDQQREAELTELRAICEQAEELAALDDADLAGADGRMRALSDPWHAAGRRPADLNARFEKAESRLRERLDEAKKQARQQARAAIEQFAESIQSQWEKRLAGKRQQTVEAPVEIIDDSDLASSLAERAKCFADPEAADESLHEQVGDNFESARQIVVEMEFLAGMDTPQADRQLRMDYQVSRLAERMSGASGQTDLATELAGLQRRWYLSFPHPPDRHGELAKRFEKCQNVIESMIGQ